MTIFFPMSGIATADNGSIPFLIFGAGYFFISSGVIEVLIDASDMASHARVLCIAASLGSVSITMLSVCACFRCEFFDR
ncbi:MAG: hypothetical protein EMLJLAPB_01225 [Candidatus Argoarchaeum ethanivorans]|uniref:Uncharacterized protein n=1 Tax=Candidatus Argoarchaeum ethanivorans TaxID=2608793 RepID=A0A811TH95_9EURY|nr:MAG: hypothetical protein EMLJLAPB_01225 [Candidatus Argoarchaeum ethanivorans]